MRALVLTLSLIPWAATAETLVVLNKGADTAMLVDLETGEVRATTDTGDGPHEVSIAADGRRAIVTDYGGPRAGRTLSIIDLAYGETVGTIELPSASRPHGIHTLDGDRVAVTAEVRGSLLIVDYGTGQVLETLETDQTVSHMVAVSRDGARAYVSNMGSGSVTAFDLATGGRDIARTGRGAEGLDVSPDGDSLWVANREDDTITVLAARSLTVLDEIAAPGYPIRLKFSPDGRIAVTSNAVDATLSVFDTGARELVRTVALPDGSLPIGILFHPDGRSLFVALNEHDEVLRLSTDDWSVMARYEVGDDPDGLAYSPR